MISIALLLAGAPAFQDTAGLDRAVAAFTGRPLGAEGGARTAIDPRLRLAACSTVAMSWRTEAHDAVVVTCAGPNWRIFVPTVRTVAAAPSPAARPAAIAAAKVEPVVRRGDPVVIEAGSQGFSITREGVALGDAAPGARFGVRVENARAPVQAIAVGAGRARLPGSGE